MLGYFCIFVLIVAGMLFSRPAQGQACCATGSGLSPARLGLHENYGLGVTLRAQMGLGRHDATGQYLSAADGTRELGFAEDVFGALRWIERGQVAVLLPVVQNYRRSHTETSTGAGLGDINLAMRYDFIWASRYRYVPGIAMLIGVTLPSGTPAETATRPLATDATGRGLLQGNFGVALEKVLGPTVTSVAGIIAWRNSAEFHGVTIAAAPEMKALATLAYVLPEEQVIGLFGSYAVEGNSRLDGRVAEGSARREVQLGAFTALPLSESLRLRFGLALAPPVDGFGRNQPATVSTFAGIHWSRP